MGFIDDDVNRVLEAYRLPEMLNKPQFTIKNNNLVRNNSMNISGIVLSFIMSENVFFSLIMHEIYLSTTAKNIVTLVLKKISQDTHLRNSRLIIIRIPTYYNYSPYPGLPHKYID